MLSPSLPPLFSARFAEALATLCVGRPPVDLCVSFLFEESAELLAWIEQHRRADWMLPSSIARSVFELTVESTEEAADSLRLGVERVLRLSSREPLVVAWRHQGWRPVRVPSGISARDVSDAIHLGLVTVSEKGEVRPSVDALEPA